MPGRRMVAPGIAARAAASPSALLRAYFEPASGLAPSAERCTSRLAPDLAAASATVWAPMACTL